MLRLPPRFPDALPDAGLSLAAVPSSPSSAALAAAADAPAVFFFVAAAAAAAAAMPWGVAPLPVLFFALVASSSVELTSSVLKSSLKAEMCVCVVLT